jgi:hypothetical protein
MNLRRRALVALVPLTLAALLPPRNVVAAPAVDAGALAHCAAINGADERLACYDSLARARSSPPSAAAPAPAPVKASRQAAPATHSAAATAAPAAAATGAAVAGAAAASTDPAAKSFGLTPHAAPEQGAERIQAQATRVDIDRLGTVRLSLDNGQVWTFNAPEALIRVGDTITIKRGTLGSFLLTTPAHHTYKAQRSQ